MSNHGRQRLNIQPAPWPNTSCQCSACVARRRASLGNDHRVCRGEELPTVPPLLLLEPLPVHRCVLIDDGVIELLQGAVVRHQAQAAAMEQPRIVSRL
tara:strand:+ start:231 stop:524 length:294 start_codon:yes stop_codon:yes gene_type:complete